MKMVIESMLGPEVTHEVSRESRSTYRTPTLLLQVSGDCVYLIGGYSRWITGGKKWKADILAHEYSPQIKLGRLIELFE
jgi:hypothetical protein